MWPAGQIKDILKDSVPHFGYQTAEMTDAKIWEEKTAGVQGLAEGKLVSQREI